MNNTSKATTTASGYKWNTVNSGYKWTPAGGYKW